MPIFTRGSGVGGAHHFDNCVAFNEHYTTLYEYVPVIAVAITFVVLFFLSTFAHLFEAARRRRPTSFLFAIGALVECMGHSARIWSSKCPYNRDSFIIQTIAFIVGPSFILIGIYLVLRALMQRLSRNTNFLSANVYFYILLSSEVIALSIQLLGAGFIARSMFTDDNSKLGTSMLLAGTSIQLFTILLFLIISADFLRRIYKNFALTTSELFVVFATAVSMSTITIRGIYHAIDYSQVYKATLSTHEFYFVAFDAVTMFIAVVCFNIVDPARSLREGFVRVDLRIYVDDTDGESTSEIVYKGERFEMVKLEDY